MKIGVVFPQTEFGSDWGAVRDYAQTVEGMGLTHIVAYDHVLGARPPVTAGPYTYKDSFLEPFVLYAYMAGLTERAAFCPGIIILPQRQTALVAKQAATLDVLCRGRLRMGVGLGWNEIEYIALNEDFRTRGRRMEEQVEVLRLLWTQPLVDYKGRWHTIPGAGLNPLPIQRPIPLWFGAKADPALRRAARLADGWLNNSATPEDARPMLEKLERYLAEAGRSRAEFGVEGRIQFGAGQPEEWRRQQQAWEALGATHLALNTMRAGLTTPGQHLAALRQMAEALGVAVA